jgi:hypothetical protein
VRRFAAATLAVLGVAWPAAAQDRRWEVEFVGGGVVSAPASAGSISLPAPGAALVTSNPIYPAREIPSWLFGDGARLLNDVNAQFGIDPRVTPLETMLRTPDSGAAAILGIRVRRYMSPRTSVEFGLETTPSATKAPDDFAAAVEATRSSFTTAFGALAGSGPFSGVSIDATAAADPGAYRETSVTGALNVHWRTAHALRPYATAGGGVLFGSGSLPSAQLSAGYRFSILGEVPIVEMDSVQLHYDRPASFVIVLGGGVAHALSAAWGLTVDARALFGPDRTRILLDATPSTTRGTPAGFIESFTNPAVQFSNDPTTGRRSSLTAPPLNGFEAYSGGTRARVTVTVGVTRRF